MLKILFDKGWHLPGPYERISEAVRLEALAECDIHPAYSFRQDAADDDGGLLMGRSLAIDHLIVTNDCDFCILQNLLQLRNVSSTVMLCCEDALELTRSRVKDRMYSDEASRLTQSVGGTSRWWVALSGVLDGEWWRIEHGVNQLPLQVSFWLRVPPLRYHRPPLCLHNDQKICIVGNRRRR
jgi:hypothetical protein